MTNKKKEIKTESPGQRLSCCRVEAITSIDERGQMVLPKDVRERAGIKAGDKLAVLTWEKEDRVCCISLVKSDTFTGMIKEVLGPMVDEIARDRDEKGVINGSKRNS